MLRTHGGHDQIKFGMMPVHSKGNARLRLQQRPKMLEPRQEINRMVLG